MDSRINELWSTVEVWYDYYWYWLMAGEIVGCIIVVGLIAVASSPPLITRFIETKNLAFFIAALGAMNTFLDPLGRAAGYGQALTTLQIALSAIPKDAKNVSADQREEAIKKAQDAEATGLKTIRDKSVAQRPERTKASSQ
jgi:hypothetical protein